MTKLMGIDGAWDTPTEYEVGNYVKTLSGANTTIALGTVGRIINVGDDIDVEFKDGQTEIFDYDELLLVSPATYSSLSAYEQAVGKPYESINTSSPAVMDNVTRSPDPVNHPSHYGRFPVEIITITEQLDFNRGNAVKYLVRAGFKEGADELEDLRKSLWYTNRAIEKLIKERSGGDLEGRSGV